MRIFLTSLFTLAIFFNSYANDELRKGKDYVEKSKYDSAKYFFNKGIINCDNKCEDTILAYLHLHLAKSYQLLQKHDSALVNYNIALDLFENNENGKANTLISIAEFYRNLNKHSKSITYLNKVNDIRHFNVLPKRTLAYFYNRYAAILSESTSDVNRVIDYSNLVIKYAKEISDKDLEAASYNEIGFAYEKIKDDRAIANYKKSLEIYEIMNNSRYAASVLTNIARTYHHKNQFVKSLEYSSKGIEKCGNNDWVSVIDELQFYQYQSYSNLKMYKEALDAFIKYHHASRKETELEWSKSLAEIEAKYELDSKEKKIKNAEREIEISNLEIKSKTTQRNFLILLGIMFMLLFILVFIAYKKNKTSKLKLEKSLEQKELLLQEVHHRVKNNLTLLKSLLYLRAKASNDADLIMILNECQSRIHSIALIHQNLYDIDDSSNVDFNVFINELFRELSSVYKNSEQNIELILNTRNINLKLSDAVFLGLIVNELATNSFKYAFTNMNNGEIKIDLSRVGDQILLGYSDNGMGLPFSFNKESSGGFGFKLINILLNQINAEMKYKKDNLSRFTISMPIEK